MENDFRLDRVRYVTTRYPQLQGLRLVPLAFVFVMSACWRAGLFRLPGDQTAYGPRAWFWGGLIVAVLASYVARAWYAHHVGAVGQRYVQSAAIPILATCALVGAASAFQLAFAWQVSLPTAAVATVLCAVGTRHYEFRGHYVLAAALLALASVLRLTDLPPNALGAAFDAVVGSTILITAVGDHRLLIHTFCPPRQALA